MNAGADELDVVEVIFRSPEYLEAHMVSVQGKASNFGGFVCVYNILMRIHQHIKVEEKMPEVMKHNDSVLDSYEEQEF